MPAPIHCNVLLGFFNTMTTAITIAINIVIIIFLVYEDFIYYYYFFEN